MSLCGETIGGAGGLMISSSLRYSTTSCWIFMSAWSMSQSLLQKMDHKCWVISIPEVISCWCVFLAVHDVESDLWFWHGSEAIPRTFPMTRATKFDPYHLEPLLILDRSLRPEVERPEVDLKCVVLFVCYRHDQKDSCFTSACLLSNSSSETSQRLWCSWCVTGVLVSRSTVRTTVAVWPWIDNQDT